MKTAILFLAAGVLSASAAARAQTIIQQNQGRVAPVQSGTNLPIGNIPAGQPQIGGVALPQLPANLQNPMAAGQASADIYAFMALFQKMAQEQRLAAREQRSTEREAQVAALQDAAEKMKQAAAAAMQQAQVTGAMAIASGAMSAGVAGAGAQLKPGMQGKTATGATGKTPVASQLQAPTKALTAQEKQQATGAMANAQQGFAANMASVEADRKKAEMAGLAAAQTQAQNAQQVQAQQAMQHMMDVIRDVQQKLQAIQQSQTETAQIIMRN